MQRAGYADAGTPVQKARHRLHVERGRHDDDTQIASRKPGLSRKRQPDVGVNAALVEFVEHDGREVREQRIPLQARGENAFGDDEQPGVSDEVLFESNLPANLAPERPAPLVGDTPRDGAGGDSPRLQQDDRTRVDERWWNPRGLAGAGRGREHHSAPACERLAHLTEVRVNGKRWRGRRWGQSRGPREEPAHPGRGRESDGTPPPDRWSCRPTECVF